MSVSTSNVTELLPVVTWARVDKGLHVGSRRGEYVGLVETNPDGTYVAFDAYSEPIGRFDSLKEAKASTGSVTTNGRIVRRRRRAHRTLAAAATVTGTVAAAMALTAGFLLPAA